jgi:transcriptional regulator with XRE-family HTH domain
MRKRQSSEVRFAEASRKRIEREDWRELADAAAQTARRRAPDRLRDAVNSLGGISEAARRLGVAKATIAEWLNEGALPNGDALVRLGRITGYSVDWLLGFDDVSAERGASVLASSAAAFAAFVERGAGRYAKYLPHRNLDGSIRAEEMFEEAVCNAAEHARSLAQVDAANRDEAIRVALFGRPADDPCAPA